MLLFSVAVLCLVRADVAVSVVDCCCFAGLCEVACCVLACSFAMQRSDKNTCCHLLNKSEMMLFAFRLCSELLHHGWRAGVPAPIKGLHSHV